MDNLQHVSSIHYNQFFFSLSWFSLIKVEGTKLKYILLLVIMIANNDWTEPQIADTKAYIIGLFMLHSPRQHWSKLYLCTDSFLILIHQMCNALQFIFLKLVRNYYNAPCWRRPFA